MDEEMLLDEAARLFAACRQGGKSQGLYLRMALHCCLAAAERRTDRLYPETAGGAGGGEGRGPLPTVPGAGCPG